MRREGLVAMAGKKRGKRGETFGSLLNRQVHKMDVPFSPFRHFPVCLFFFFITDHSFPFQVNLCIQLGLPVISICFLNGYILTSEDSSKLTSDPIAEMLLRHDLYHSLGELQNKMVARSLPEAASFASQQPD